MADVFISYACEDRPFVRRLHNTLENHNCETWVDWQDIPATAKFLKEIYAAIESAHTFVFIISPDSVGSEICNKEKEIDHGVKHHKRLVPIMYRDVDDKAVPENLRKINWVYFRKTEDFDAAFNTLKYAIDLDLKWVHAHTRLLTRAIDWDTKECDKSLLLSGNDLRDAEEWMAKGPEKSPKPTSLQTRYIIKSRKAATKRQRITTGAVIE